MVELLIILLLLVGNGVFAMAEIALVSAKRTRLQALADQGNGGARKALQLAEDPERLLSTVQIGITLVGVLAGAFGGATLSAQLSPLVARIPGITPETAVQVSFGVVVAAITYLSLIIGELVPKGLALRQPEAIACAMSRPMDALARLAKPLVWFLEKSTRLVMRLFGRAITAQSGPTRDEVHVLVREGTVAGSLGADESEMVAGVLELHELRAEEVMQPKPKVQFLQGNDCLDAARAAIISGRQEVFPVIEGNRDQVLGTLSLRELYFATDPAAKLRSLIKPAVFVPENQPALSLLASLRRAPHLAALVVDEFGTVRGMVTLKDLLEEVVGDLAEVAPTGSDATLRAHGDDGWIADGAIEIDVVTKAIPDMEALVEAEEDPFQTLAGYILHRMDRLPMEGESFSEGGYEFEILDMDRHRIDKVLIRKLQPETAPLEESSPAAE